MVCPRKAHRFQKALGGGQYEKCLWCMALRDSVSGEVHENKKGKEKTGVKIKSPRR
jgi:hypothetical protein